MKRFAFLILIASILGRCGKSDVVQPVRYELRTDSIGATENFKLRNSTKYSIQFPAGFQGGLIIGFEGNLFNKYRSADSTYISYANCSPLQCYDFGDTLIDPTVAYVTGIFNYGHDVIVLNHRIEFTSNSQLVAVYYYDDVAVSHGKLFWKDGGVFKDALDAKYRRNNLSQVIEIIRTIREI